MLYDLEKGNKDSVKAFIQDEFRRRDEYMRDLHRIWMLNLAWLRGFQNSDYDRNLRKYVTDTKQPKWRVRLVSNIMLPLLRKMTAKITHYRPVWDVIPATPDEEDIQIAATASRVLQKYWDILSMNRKLIRLCTWMGTCGCAYLKSGWDPEKGEEIDVPTEGIEEQLLAQFLNESGLETKPKTVKVNQGDPFNEVVSPFNITFDPASETFEDTLWVIETRVRSKDYLFDRYGKKVDSLTETENTDIYVNTAYYASGNASFRFKGVLTHELFIKRSRKFKRGLYALLANDTWLISPKPLPYDHGELPYDQFIEVYDPGSAHGTSISEQVRPLQARYNRLQSAIVENANLMGNLKWLNPRQSGVKDFDNQPGGVIVYNAPYEPRQAEARPIPAYFQQMLDRTRLDIQDAASSHDVSEAKAEPGIRSGRAVLALQDADDSVLGPVLQWFDDALANNGRKLLNLIHQYVPEERTLEVEGEFNQLETLTFTGLELKGPRAADYFRVRCKTAGRQAMSRAGREAIADFLVERGILNPQDPNDKQLLLNVVGVADLFTVFDESRIDRTRQYKEILTLIQGQQASVYLGQNHAIHIDSIRKFISSSKWDQLSEDQKKVVLDHLDQHMRMQAFEMARQQGYVQAAMQGVLGGTGTQAPGNPTAGQAPGQA